MAVFCQLSSQNIDKMAKNAFLSVGYWGGDTFVKVVIRKIPKLHICFCRIFAP